MLTRCNTDGTDAETTITKAIADPATRVALASVYLHDRGAFTLLMRQLRGGGVAVRTITDIEHVVRSDAARAAAAQPVEDNGDNRQTCLELARQLLTDRYTHGDDQTLRWWRDEFWEWNSRCYIARTDSEIRALVLAWLEQVVDFPHPHLARDVVAALQSLTRVDFHIEQPVWLGDGGPPADHQLIALANGLLDLDALLAGKADVLRPLSPRWFSPIALDYAFDAAAKCPRLLGFLDECLERDPERIALFQEWLGYTLTNDTGLQKFMIWEGDGQNGKSVACEIQRHLVGPANCAHVPLGLFGQRFQLTPTLGKLVNICADVGELDKVAEGHLKALTSGDAMHFDRKGLPPLEVKPTARVLVALNNRPRFSDRSSGIWRRMLVMPWRVEIPEAKRDLTLTQGDRPDWPFRAELPGILNWAIAGLKRLRLNGRFTVPTMSRAALEEYRLENNPARAFLQETYVVALDREISVAEVMEKYKDWCESYGYQRLNEANLGKEIRRVFAGVHKQRQRRNGTRETVYIGLGSAKYGPYTAPGHGGHGGHSIV